MTGVSHTRRGRPWATRCGLLVTLLVAASFAPIPPASASHSVSCRADRPVAVGEPMTWRANVTGASPNVTYAWSGDGGLSGSTAVVRTSYPDIGAKVATVVATDSATGDQASADCLMHVVPTTHSEPPNVTPVLWVPADVNPGPLVVPARRVWRSIHAGFYHLYGKTFRMRPLLVVRSTKTEADICGGDCNVVGQQEPLMNEAFADGKAAIGGEIPYARAVLVMAWGGSGFAGSFSWDLAHGAIGDWALAPATGMTTPALESDITDFAASIVGDYRHAVSTIAHELNHLIGWDEPHDFSLDAEPTQYEKRVVLAGPFLTQVPQDVTPPTASILAPAAGARLAGTAPVRVNASDAGGMDAVVLLVDKQFVAADRTAPFSLPFDTRLVGHGKHTLEVIAYDAAGNTTLKTREVSVMNELPHTSCRGGFPQGTFHVCYFDGVDLTGTYLGTLLDHPYPVPATNAGWGLRHEWGGDEIAFGRTDSVSGVWRGRFDFPPDNYTLRFFHDDGLRVRVNDQLVIDNWEVGVFFPSTVVALGEDTRLEIEWFEGAGAQGLRFWYQPTDADAAVEDFPNRVVVQQGTLRSGGPPSLTAEDDANVAIDSTKLQSQTTSWIGEYVGVPNNLTNLRVNYTGANSRVCTQKLAIRDWVSSSWTHLDTRRVGADEVAITDLAPAGAPTRFVRGSAGPGDVQLRVTCARPVGSFVALADHMRLDYLVPGD